MADHQPGALFLMDIDNFKQVNDTYGHQTGDQVLILLAQVMKTHSRSQDVAARIGGDEFILFLPGFTREDLLRERAGAICASFRSGGAKYDKVPLSVSIGIAVSDEIRILTSSSKKRTSGCTKPKSRERAWLSDPPRTV